MKYEYYKNTDGWRWRFKSEVNGKIVASGQGYANKADCLHAIALLKDSADAEEVETEK